MTTFINNFSEISENYEVLICDLWGCLHNGKVSFREALKTLKNFRDNSGVVILVTNAPRPTYLVEEQIHKLGINSSNYDLLLTSGELTSEYIGMNYDNEVKVFHIGDGGNHSVFENIKLYNKTLEIKSVALADADVLVCTEPFNPEEDKLNNYKDIVTFGVERNLPFICSNPDLVVDIGDVRELCAGSIAKMYESLGGKTIYLGKPYKKMYQKAYQFLSKTNQIKKSKILCIGDGITTDIKGAALERLDSLLVIGGLLRNELLLKKNNKYYIDVKGFNKYILTNNVIEPTFAIKSFE